MIYYTVKRSERITVRDEMFRKLLEVANTIESLLWQLNKSIFNYFCLGQVEEKEKFEKLVEEYNNYYNRNSLYLLSRLTVETAGDVLLDLVEFINGRDAKGLMYYLEKETIIEYLKDIEEHKLRPIDTEVLDLLEQEVIPACAISDAITHFYIIPVLEKIDERLGMFVIEEEIDRFKNSL